MQSFDERRGSNRPDTGARRPCPACAGTMRFFERYTVQHGDHKRIEPAWVCGCGHELYVRKPVSARPSRKAAS